MFRCQSLALRFLRLTAPPLPFVVVGSVSFARFGDIDDSDPFDDSDDDFERNIIINRFFV